MSYTLCEIQRIIKIDCMFHKLAVILLYFLYFINILKTYSYTGKCMQEYTPTNSLFIGQQGNFLHFQQMLIIDLFSTKFPLFHNFILFCSNNMVFINRMLKLKYPLTVIVHSHLLRYDGKICFAVYCIMLLQKCVPDAYCVKPVCMYLQQIDHLIGNIKTAFGVQFFIMWGAFHCMRDH